ncbi:5-aminoimidazole-4-carboxamide ribonucleotide transformylase [Microlunatus sp. GCM10028923]|uniref:5-aminoimidazole-4-carboxamide ribonucleotide transformylase n=1 Tax=Microlunatus sp. GCM10028923 TaxID=3273400 RepID=UPI00361591B1
MHLRYGLNPHQRATAEPIGRPPFRMINGEPSMINLLDASNGWQLVAEARARLGRPVTASIKHVAPAGAAAAGPVDDVIMDSWPIEDAPTPVLSAYLRARDADPRSSYGDLVAVSDSVDLDLARFLGGVISDGIVAPGYEPGAVELLRRKKRGRFLIMEADPAAAHPAEELRQIGGLMITQQTDHDELTADLLPAQLDPGDRDTALLAMITARHTPSNTVVAARDGAAIGVAAGQQSRVDCTRLAVGKASAWWFRRHPTTRSVAGPPGTRRQDRLNLRLALATGDPTPLESGQLLDELGDRLPTAADRAAWLAGLDRVIMVHDGAIPFRDNVDHAARIGTTMIIEPGGSTAADTVEQACTEHGIALIRTGRRLFLH